MSKWKIFGTIIALVLGIALVIAEIVLIIAILAGGIHV